MLKIGQIVYDAFLDLPVIIVGLKADEKFAIVSTIYNDGSCRYDGHLNFSQMELYYKDDKVYYGEVVRKVKDGVIDLSTINNSYSTQRVLKVELHKVETLIHKPYQENVSL